MTIKRPKSIIRQVNEILRERIRSQVYKSGDRLPAESDLAKEFDVSRATVRSALALLESEGLILRKQGVGTYINKQLDDVNTHLGGLWEFTSLIETSGYTPTIKPVNVDYRTPTAAETEIFNVDPQQNLLILDRLFLADDRPVIVAQNIISQTEIQTALDEIDASLNIQEFVKTYCDSDIAYTTSEISAVMPNDYVKEIFQYDTIEPMLRLKITFYDEENNAIIYGISHIDGTMLNLRLVQAWV